MRPVGMHGSTGSRDFVSHVLVGRTGAVDLVEEWHDQFTAVVGDGVVAADIRFDQCGCDRVDCHRGPSLAIHERLSVASNRTWHRGIY